MTTRSGDNLPYAVGLETEEIKFICEKPNEINRGDINDADDDKDT